MEIIDPGHIYELRQLGSDETQILRFIKRSGGAVQYDEEWSGLQTQEVLRALIDRTVYLNKVLPCRETEEAVKHLRFGEGDAILKQNMEVVESLEYHYH